MTGILQVAKRTRMDKGSIRNKNVRDYALDTMRFLFLFSQQCARVDFMVIL